ncbi:glycosyltransferase [Agrococcus citreus]|uniref:Rhamnosyltransferase n=1 Tax=Agrococcus citreus TaxID=84643 RepID=A0ABN1YRN8_9MICO
MSDFEHFLLTRFAVRIKPGAPLPSDEWLRSRISIFEAICLPSVLRQSTQSFSWLLFVDSSVPVATRERLERVLPKNAEVVIVDAVCEERTIVHALLKRATKPYVVTSRLDNDDAIDPDYISIVQREIGRTPRVFLNFPRGLQYSRARLLAYRHASNAFISHVDARGPHMQTVFVDWHDRLARHGVIRQWSEREMWLQNCHGGNVKNQERGIRVSANQHRGRYPFLVLPSETQWGLLSDKAWTSMNLLRQVARNPKALRRLLPTRQR